MKETLLMSIDLGTSFIKVGIYNLASECISVEIEPVKDYRPSQGVFIQKGEELFDSVIACMKKTAARLAERAKNIEAIAFTGQMAGFMGVDSDWNDITTWSCSLDSRYMPYAQRQMKELKDKFLITGGTNFPQMAPKYEWFKTEFPEEAKKIAKYLMISGYVIGRLGEVPIDEAVIDRSYTQWTGLADVQNDRWSDEICNAIGLKREYLPKIVNSNYICGRLAPSMAQVTGLKSGIPLVSGAGDKAAGCLGAAAVIPGEMIFEASSYGQISYCVEEYRPDYAERRYDVIPSAVPGEFYAAHFAAGSGITLDWFMNTFVRREGVGTKEMFAEIDHLVAGLEPGCDGVMAVGLLGGSSMPLDGYLRGLWMGFDWSHKKEHFYRALLESFAYDFSLCIRSMQKLYPEYPNDSIYIIGGGAKSPVWTQMNADVTGKTYKKLSRDDVAMWGAAILAGNAIGEYSDLKRTARDHISVVEEYKPDLQMHEKYRKYVGLYEQYMVELHDFYKRLQEIGKQ